MIPPTTNPVAEAPSSATPSSEPDWDYPADPSPMFCGRMCPAHMESYT